MDKWIVVTGACGFIGSGVVKHLNEQGMTHLILVDDPGTDERWKNLVGKEFEDLILPQDLFPWLQGKEKKIHGFIHLGACSSTLEKDATFLLENNYRYTKTLAEYALEQKLRFIYASSAATYGDGEKGFSDDHSLLERFHPLNMYGYSKHLFDLWAKRKGVLDRIVGLKYFNVFGPNEYHKGPMTSPVLKFFEQVQKEGSIRLFQSSDKRFGDGEQCRDFIYVKDAVRMTCDFLHNTEGGIFNIGRGVPGTWNQVAKGVMEALNLPVSIDYVPMPEDLAKQYQNYTCAEMDKLKKTTILSKTRSLEESIREYVQDYLVPHRWW